MYFLTRIRLHTHETRAEDTHTHSKNVWRNNVLCRYVFFYCNVSQKQRLDTQLQIIQKAF